MFTWSYNLEGGDNPTPPDPSSGEAFSGVVVPELPYAELALDPETWDLALPPHILRGEDAVIQRIRVRFRFFRSEWFLDTRQGIPYREQILIKNPNPVVISFIFRRVLVSTPGVASVTSFTATIDNEARRLVATFDAKLVDGTVLRAVDEPFIVG